MPAPLYIGIDAGGTKTALIARTSTGDFLTSLDGPGTNLRRDGILKTASVLSQLINQLPQSYSTPYLCAGVSGAGNNEIQESLQNELAVRLDLSPAHIQIRADASIAYFAAHKDRSGILVITGTGSIIWARTKTGQMVRAGGWGALLGDEGGGFQIGLAALRAISHEIDGGPTTLLSQILCKHYGLCDPSDILDFTYQQNDKIQTLAPFVLDAVVKNDEIATQIIHDQVSALAQSLKFLLLSHPHISPKLVYMGGLTKNVQYVDTLQRVLLDVKPDLSIHALQVSPVEGALNLASKMGPFDDTNYNVR